MSDWWNGLSRPKDRSEVDRLEALAEAAYARMYGARDRCEVKLCWEDASQHFYRAIEAARRLDLTHDVQRLTARKGHCYAVWHSQFRGV
jgi:hypothetical protein